MSRKQAETVDGPVRAAVGQESRHTGGTQRAMRPETGAAFCAARPVATPPAVRPACAATSRARPALRTAPRMAGARSTRRGVVRWALAAAAAAAAAAGVAKGGALAYGVYEEPPRRAAPKKKDAPQFTREGGIAFSDLEVGAGPAPGDGDFVIVDYVAYLSSGVAFDNTKQAGRKSLVFQMGKNKVIPGLETAIAGMRMGGHRLAIIPPALAYGERGVCFPDQGCLVPPGETLEYGTSPSTNGTASSTARFMMTSTAACLSADVPRPSLPASQISRCSVWLCRRSKRLARASRRVCP
jgi:FKBP-type peptidyl-prolyl cis-trans isomerase